MRLSTYEINTIKETVAQYDSNAEVYLFGSRTDDNARGGDIDLLVLSQTISYTDKLRIRIQLADRMGNQKVDLLLKNQVDNAFSQMAYQQGLKL